MCVVVFIITDAFQLIKENCLGWCLFKKKTEKKNKKRKAKLFVALSAYYVWSLAAADHTDLKKILFCSFSIITYLIIIINHYAVITTYLYYVYDTVYVIFDIRNSPFCATYKCRQCVWRLYYYTKCQKRFISFCDYDDEVVVHIIRLIKLSVMCR